MLTFIGRKEFDIKWESGVAIVIPCQYHRFFFDICKIKMVDMKFANRK